MTERPLSRSLLPNSIPFCPALAEAFDIYGALILQQLHYWLTDEAAKVRDGHRWVAKPISTWVEEFRVFSPNTIRNKLELFESKGVIITAHFGKSWDRTKWYRIDYEKLSSFTTGEQLHLPSRGKSLTKDKTPFKTMTEDKSSVAGAPQDTAPNSPGNTMKTTTSTSAILAQFQINKGTSKPKQQSKSQVLQSAWREEAPKYNPAMKMIPVFTMMDKGQFSHIANRLGTTSEKTLRFVLSRWIGYTKFVAAQTGLKKTPDSPNLGFLLKYIGEAESYRLQEQASEAPKASATPIAVSLGTNDSVMLTATGSNTGLLKGHKPVRILQKNKAVTTPVVFNTKDPAIAGSVVTPCVTELTTVCEVPEKEDVATLEHVLAWKPVKKE